MKLLDRILLWALSLLVAALGVLLIILVLFPSLNWLQVLPVRIGVGVAAALSILCAVALLIRTSAREKGEAALVAEGEDGSSFVTLDVISEMARRICQDCEGVRTCKSAVKNNGAGVDVELDLALNPGVAVAPLATQLQAQLKSRIFEMTGIRVGKVGVMVEAASEAKAPKQPQPEQLPSRVK